MWKLYVFCFQHKLKSSQKDKVRQFIAFTQTGEKSAINCLGHHDWKLDVAVDNFFQNPERYNKEPKLVVDRRRLEQLFNKYRGKWLTAIVICVEQDPLTHVESPGRKRVALCEQYICLIYPLCCMLGCTF